MNKRGDFTGVLFMIVMIATFAIFLLIVGYIAPEISNELVKNIGISSEINNSLIATTNTAQNTLPVVWLFLFGGLMLGLFATAWFVPSHPIFAPVFGILMVITVLVSVALSNAYEELTNNAILAGAAAEQGVVVFIMINLPLLSVILGAIIMVISFAKPPGGDQSALG